MRCPFGDQRGCAASPSLTKDRFSPLATLITQSLLSDTRRFGSIMYSVPQTISLQSGDHDGFWPKSAIFRADSPVAPITNNPPPLRVERKTMLEPSGEQAG